MDWDEPRAKPGRTIAIGEDLSTHSVAELEATQFEALSAEIERSRAQVAAKKAHSAAASAIFKHSLSATPNRQSPEMTNGHPSTLRLPLSGRLPRWRYVSRYPAVALASGA